jgi:AcrR family transcriptional regulator
MAEHKPPRKIPRKRSSAKAAASYHHGDLRRALLGSAEDIIRELGIAGFTLRECARRAGVSHGAPAHHFGDARGLLSALAAEGFEELAALTVARRKASSADAFSQLVASGLAYVEYAQAHPARFQLMFSSSHLDHGHEALIEAGERVYGHLVECMTRVNTEAGAPAALLTHKTTLAWSIVHGFAGLMQDNEAFAAGARAQPGGALALLEHLVRLSRPAFEAKVLPPRQRS